MSAEVARLHVKVGAKLDQFNKGMDNVSKKLGSVGKKVSGAGMSMTKGITAPAIAAGGAAFGLANKYASMGDEIAKTSTKLGISTDSLQELDYWATQNGLSSQALERAVGRLNQRIGRAAEGNEKYADAFDAVGVSLKDAEGNIRATDDVLEDTIESLMAVEDPARRSALASEVFGTKMARDLMPALEDGSLTIDEAREKIHELGGVMDEEAVKAAEDYEDAMDDLKRSFSGVWMELANQLIPIFTNQLMPAIQEKVLPALREFAGRIGGLIDWFQNLSPTLQKAIKIIAGVAIAIGPVLLVVGKVIAIVGAVIGVIGKLVAGLKVAGVAIAVLTGPIGIVIAAIGALVAGLYYLWNTNEEFREGFTEIWQGIREIFSIVISSIKEIVSSGLEYIREFWDKWGDQILGVVEPIWNQIENIINTIVSLISNTIQFYLSVIQGDWEGALKALANIGKTIWEFIAKSIENIVDGITRFLDLAFNMMVDLGRSTFGSMRDAIAERMEAVRESIISAMQNAIDWIKSLPSQAVEWGRDIIQGLINGIKRMAGRVTDAITGAVGGAVDTAKSWLGISSPSKVFKEIGENVASSFALGVESLAGQANLAVEQVVTPDIAVMDRVGQGMAGPPMSSGRVESLLREVVSAVKEQDPSIYIEMPEGGAGEDRFSRKFQHRGLGGAIR